MVRGVVFLAGLAGAFLYFSSVGCGASSSHSSGDFGGSGSTGAGKSTTGGTLVGAGVGGNTNNSAAAGLNAVGVGSGASSTTASGVVCNSGPNDDMDHDGWTVAQGDCNDCDPNVNPGAIDVGNNEDCDPNTMAVAPCDSGLTLDDTNPVDGAKAIELCQGATPDNTKTAMGPKWGVLSAAYTTANGASTSPGTQVGIMNNFGPNVKTQGGANLLVLSSGAARTATQPGACGSEDCPHNPGQAPPGFPQDVPGCNGAKNINDDIALDLHIRAPTNATGYKFDFKFYSFEFPDWVCTDYNDQFIALVNPAPMGSINGNVSFDSKNNPVSVNIAFFDVCDKSDASNFAINCQFSGNTCPAMPNPYCPSGPAQLQGTGFDIWGEEPGSSGATSWLETKAPVTGGEEFEIRFAIWDTGDTNLYSSVLVDNFQWVANGGTVTVGTDPETNPK